jgi:siderophore synthetase component
MKKFILVSAAVISAALTALPASAVSGSYCRENPTDEMCSAYRAERNLRSYCRATDYMGDGCLQVLRDRSNRNIDHNDRSSNRGRRGGIRR